MPTFVAYRDWQSVKIVFLLFSARFRFSVLIYIPFHVFGSSYILFFFLLFLFIRGMGSKEAQLNINPAFFYFFHIHLYIFGLCTRHETILFHLSLL